MCGTCNRVSTAHAMRENRSNAGVRTHTHTLLSLSVAWLRPPKEKGEPSASERKSVRHGSLGAETRTPQSSATVVGAKLLLHTWREVLIHPYRRKLNSSLVCGLLGFGIAVCLCVEIVPVLFGCAFRCLSDIGVYIDNTDYIYLGLYSNKAHTHKCWGHDSRNVSVRSAIESRVTCLASTWNELHDRFGGDYLMCELINAFFSACKHREHSAKTTNPDTIESLVVFGFPLSL